jgi:hypothetical protein
MVKTMIFTTSFPPNFIITQMLLQTFHPPLSSCLIQMGGEHPMQMLPTLEAHGQCHHLMH